jgi:AcrR family transcriptional regulator
LLNKKQENHLRKQNPATEKNIRSACLSLLLEKEPELIGMRDIATRCGISATAIYYYYSDKEKLFEAVKKDCLKRMDEWISSQVSGTDTLSQLRSALEAFRDWAFANPRIALLVMGRLKANTGASSTEMPLYYRSLTLGKELLDKAVAEGSCRSNDTILDSSVCVSAVWGTIESILLNRSAPELWNRGKETTDRIIDICIQAVHSENRQ